MKIEVAPEEYEIYSNWDDARLYCFARDIDGKVGWRLPTIEELDGIYGLSMRIHGWYWSSDEGHVHGVWTKSFGTGRREIRNKEIDYGRVMIVRDLKAD